jgi:nucleotide sugar dehydrogenase
MDTVCVIGVGFVGESLVKVFSKNHRVIGYDTLPSRVDDLKTLFHNNTNVTIQNTTDGLESCDLFCISVPTLLRKDEETGKNYVDGSYIQAALETIKNKAKRGSTIVIESSVSVGMTRKLLNDLAKERGLFVGFSPERIDPGRIEPPAERIPKIVSGLDEESLHNVCRFYNRAFENIVKVSSLETAEMCKLYENCFRMVNIAYANEGADACKRFGIDPFEMIRACETKPYGFMPFYPGLGVGGHCKC